MESTVQSNHMKQNSRGEVIDDNLETIEYSSNHETIHNKEDIVDDLFYDVHNLIACNYHPLPSHDAITESSLLNLAQRSTQLLINRLLDCPRESSDVGTLILLPNEIMRLPRGTKIPEPKPETKWEKFAKEKGIKKKKRDRMVYDEAVDEYKPRYGYKRIKNGKEDIPIVEIKPGQDPNVDPWEASRNDKKERVSKNVKQQLRNKQMKSKPNGKISPGIPIDIEKSHANRKRGKEGVQAALQIAQHSTASMGRYDELRKGEAAPKLKGKKRSFRDNMINVASNEKDVMKSQLRIVSDKIEKKQKGVTNSLKAYEGILPDAPTNEFKQKKGKNRVKFSETRKKSSKKQ